MGSTTNNYKRANAQNGNYAIGKELADILLEERAAKGLGPQTKAETEFRQRKFDSYVLKGGHGAREQLRKYTELRNDQTGVFDHDCRIIDYVLDNKMAKSYSRLLCSLFRADGHHRNFKEGALIIGCSDVEFVRLYPLALNQFERQFRAVTEIKKTKENKQNELE